MSINVAQPYAIGAYYFTGWHSNAWYLLELSELMLGHADWWGGVRDYALGLDPWALYSFVPNPAGLRAYYATRQPLIGYYICSISRSWTLTFNKRRGPACPISTSTGYGTSGNSRSIMSPRRFIAF